MDIEPIPDPIAVQQGFLEHPLQTDPIVPICQGIKEDGKPVIWIAHLFSGRCRLGDCHWWTGQIGHFPWPEVTIRMIGYCRPSDAEGNLAKGDSLTRLLRLRSKAS